MSYYNETCEPERFAASLASMLANLDKAVESETGDAVRKSTLKGARLLRGKYTEGIGKHAWSAEYRSGFRAHVEGGKEPSGEIGNKRKPGLVHLLEKGHATLTGRRTNAYPHMEPAFDEIKEDFVKRVEKAVDVAVNS